MKFQLVVQFSEELCDDIDWIADIEDQLDNMLVDAEVDGHDLGNGEINIFIHTNNPMNSFEVVKSIVGNNIGLENIKVAYRENKEEQYTTLWPENLTNFKVT